MRRPIGIHRALRVAPFERSDDGCCVDPPRRLLRKANSGQELGSHLRDEILVALGPEHPIEGKASVAEERLQLLRVRRAVLRDDGVTGGGHHVFRLSEGHSQFPERTKGAQKKG